jgi:hypothetical protein
MIAAPQAVPRTPRFDLPLPLNDLGNAQRFVLLHGHRFFYRHGCWYAWTGPDWRPVDGEIQVRLAAQQTVRTMAWEAMLLDRWAVESGNASRLDAMVELAKPYLDR